MDHEQIQDKLSLFHDGEVTEPERREVAAHLSRCAECRGRLEQWDRFGSLLSKTAVNYDSE